MKIPCHPPELRALSSAVYLTRTPDDHRPRVAGRRGPVPLSSFAQCPLVQLQHARSGEPMVRVDLAT